MDGCYSEDYVEARAKFLSAAIEVGAVAERFALDKPGPKGEELSTDVAWLGPREARHVLVTISGTHGVEGFFGSATQIEWLRRAKTARLPDDIAALHIHAINPYGFAWLRRTNEDNVDVNRNRLNFDAALPANPMYEELSDDLCPSDWSAETQTRAAVARYGFGTGSCSLPGCCRWSGPDLTHYIYQAGVHLQILRRKRPVRQSRDYVTAVVRQASRRDATTSEVTVVPIADQPPHHVRRTHESRLVGRHESQQDDPRHPYATKCAWGWISTLRATLAIATTARGRALAPRVPVRSS